MLFSILIPTLQERRASFTRLYEKLRAQIVQADVEDAVEIVTRCDNREHALGAKRNALMRDARGEFIAFVDDDDDVADQYVALICRALREHSTIDCLGITGIVYFRGTHPHRFVYSRRYDHYFSRGGVYYRPPYILNPVRRAIARQFPFEEVNWNEDMDWALRLARARVLQREVMLDEILYHYYSRRHWMAQWAIDVTEPVRHPLGLQWANRLRAARWWRNRRQGV
jgi:glycosyltransferase involved in cell wall biosynthesis